MYLTGISKKLKILLGFFIISICGFFLSIHFFMSKYGIDKESIAYVAYIAMRIFEISLTFLTWFIFIAINTIYYNKYDEKTFFMRLYLAAIMFGLITFVVTKSEINRIFVISWFVYFTSMLYYAWKEDNISQKKKKPNL